MSLFYRQWVRESFLREEPGPVLSESVLQRIWFEQLVTNPLITLAGERIHLHHPGFWNHRAGPDFLGASFSRPDGSTCSGDVELHRHPSDWCDHAHSSHSAYQRVVLHVFWQTDPSWRVSPGVGIHQVALERQLSASLTDLVSLFHSSPAEMLSGEKPGHCHPALLSLPPEKLREILEEAGWHRLRQRRSLARARVQSLGLDQAVWIALAEGLGFSENRESFTSLARSVPVNRLLPIPDPAARAAVLYGTAGLLPDPTRSAVSPRALPWIRRLWDLWWKLRGEWQNSVLPAGLWKLGATRPVNSPYRRLAAMGFLSDPVLWPAWVGSVRRGDADGLMAILRAVSDPFWDLHAGWEGRLLPSRSRLVGADRATALLFQVLAPLAEIPERELRVRMDDWPAGGTAGLLRSASVRLLGAAVPPPDVRTHLAREGLLQIYKDFCRARPCRNCSFPAFLNQAHPSSVTRGAKPGQFNPPSPELKLPSRGL